MELEQGKLLVEIARKKIEANLKGKDYSPKKYPKEFDEEMGVFVTLETHPAKELRGCIGYPEPIMPLIKAIQDAAISASTRDPRFSPVSSEEMKHLVVEVTVLTKPKLIQVKKPEEYLEKVKIGRDGLIVESGMARGLLLPQVPIEWKWSVEEFLNHTCEKAGLPPTYWTHEETNIYSFEGQLFSEEAPSGKAIKKNFS
ncbi:TIGR00296 family protein [Candidatus Undinarchaeota archaeon]